MSGNQEPDDGRPKKKPYDGFFRPRYDTEGTPGRIWTPGTPITVATRPVEITALESFTVKITTPPITCRRCKTPLTGPMGSTVMPNRAEVARLADRGLSIVLYYFCSPCADAVVEQVRVGASCYHGTPTGQACEGCNTPLRESS